VRFSNAHSSLPIVVVTRRASRSVLLAALRGLHLDSLLDDDSTCSKERGMHKIALGDELRAIGFTPNIIYS
jgi:hypothetical protein